MAMQQPDTVNVNVVVWPIARKYLSETATGLYRQAARASTEFERGRLSGQAEMAEKLMNLPEALAILAEEDQRERTSDVKG